MGVSFVLKAGRSRTLREQLVPVARFALRPSGLLLPLLVLLPSLVWHDLLPTLVLVKFAAACVVLFWLPGLAIARACRLRCGPTELAALTLGLGLAASNLTFVVASACKVPLGYALLPLGSAVFLLLRARRRAPPSIARVLPGVSGAVLLVASAIAGALTLSPVHGVDFVHDSVGMHLVGWPDGTLHAAITNELSHQFPPRSPLLGDHALAYHYANELSAVVFVKFLGLPATTVCLRLLPALFVAFAVLSFAALLHQLTGSLPAALLTPVLILLGEDFSYLVDWWRGATVAVDYFRMPSVFGLYFANPNLPALAAFACAGLSVGRAVREGSRRLAWLGVSAALLGLAGSYKVFFGIQALSALGACVVLGGRYRFRFAQLLALTLCALLVFQAPWLLSHEEEKVLGIVPTFFTDWIPSMITNLGLGTQPWLADVVQIFAARRLSGSGLAEWAGIAVPLFVVGTLGVRLLGLPRLLSVLRAPSAVTPTLSFLAWFVVCGYALGLGLRITPIDYPNDYNNSVWFVVESKLLSCVFVGVALGAWYRNWSPRRVVWVASLQILVLAAPGTVNLFGMLGRTSGVVVATADELKVAEYFEHRVSPGAVVLSDSSNLRRLLLGVSRMRVPLAPEFYPTSFLRRPRLEERQRDVASFWQSYRAGDARDDVLRRYGVDYVAASRPLSGVSPVFQAETAFVYRAADLAHRVR